MLYNYNYCHYYYYCCFAGSIRLQFIIVYCYTKFSDLPCTEMCKCQGCTNKQEEAIADGEVDGEDIEEEQSYSEY